jgi:replicative DNA helicase
VAKYTPYDNECIVLASVLQWGRPAALQLLPALHADWFICGMGGSLGGPEHKAIWQAIEYVTMVENSEPFIGNILPYLAGENSDMHPYLKSLPGRLASYYQIHTLDIGGLRAKARRIYHDGKLWRAANQFATFGKIATPEEFMRISRKIGDIDTWINDSISKVQSAIGDTGDEGYKHASVVAKISRARHEAQKRGEQVSLLPVGMPALYRHGLLPQMSLAVDHGPSGGGKSTLVHNVFNLGTALGLLANNVKGCVAINSLEMSSDQLMDRMAASLAGFDTFKLMTEPESMSGEDFARFESYMDFVGKLPIEIDGTSRITSSTMQFRLTGLHLSDSGPVRQLSTDYLELFDRAALKTPRDVEQSQERILDRLGEDHFKISRDFPCSVIAVSQTTYNEQTKRNKTWIAGSDGLRWCKGLEHKADIVMEIVNYRALRAKGKDYTIAEDLDDVHLWVLLEKFRGGPSEKKIPLGWDQEYTRIYDPAINADFGGNTVIFEHLEEVQKLLSQHPTTAVIPLEDTPLADIDTIQDSAWIEDPEVEDDFS